MSNLTLSEKIQGFYNQNTELFINLGHSSEGSIRRAIWAYGVSDRHEALHYVDNQICKLLLSLHNDSTPHIVDLGCGVASSLCYIESQISVTGVGITISEGQCKLANDRIRKHAYAEKLHCIQADFCKLPKGIEKADLVFAIESFVHAQSAAAFFHQASSLVKPGGYLIICDDFLTDESILKNKKAKPWLKQFQDGWLVSSLLSHQQVNKYASQAGFQEVECQDLSPYLKLKRPRDYFIKLLIKVMGKHALKYPYFQMLYGGNALQKCLAKKWISHELIIWKKINV
jgi:ubiquinone/menaquinone biosynthesis C-methylase UbiE